jgi:Protein of unknown function (DUF3570)
MTFAQQLPANEVQVNFSSYFDDFHVTVFYPSVFVTKKISETTSITGRYLVDMISAASTKGYKAVPGIDVVTSASNKNGKSKIGSPLFGEVRHEFNIGFAQLVGNGILTFDGLYSTEHDYTSSTLIGNFKKYFAENNTSVELGIVRSWDKVFPSTKNWKKDKNIITFNANFAQVISKRLILRLLTTYSERSGLLSDNYLLVPISVYGIDSLFDPVHPDLRIRRAAALSLKYRLNEKSSLQLEDRYYWDTWDIKANTVSLNYKRYLSKYIIFGVGWRGNFQTKAFFFKTRYTNSDKYRTVDIKLDDGFSNEIQLDLILNGGATRNFLPFLDDNRVQYILNLIFYSRHTDSPYWFNHSRNLFSMDINLGIRYRY